MNQKEIYASDVTIVGGGLAGIVTAFELLDHGLDVIILERDEEHKFGGLAKESFGGIMMVNTPLQRKTGIKDNPDLALSDWLNFAQFEEKDILPRQWAEIYVNRSTELMYEWLTTKSVTFLPIVNWPERGLYQPGNSVPRWHIAWGTGFAVIESIVAHLNNHPHRSKLKIYYNHRVTNLEQQNGRIVGCRGVRENSNEPFLATAPITVIASGGYCGGNLEMVRKYWFEKWGTPPDLLLNGSHIYADGLLHKEIESFGGHLTHLNKQWHYAAGIHYPKSNRPNHGLSLVPPRSALWVNALGERIGPVPLLGYTDTRFLVEQICKQPGKYSWQIMNWKIAIKELAVSGSDFMTTFRHKKKLRMFYEILFGNKSLVRRLIGEAEDVVIADDLATLVRKMNALGSPYTVDEKKLRYDIDAYDAQIDRGKAYFNDDQLRRIANFRAYRGDRLRMCKFQKILDRKALPLIAIREFILSRKSLGGVKTDLNCRVLREDDTPVEGLFAVGETAGFGGGGIHGHGSLEGTFLGSCIINGRIAGRYIAGKEHNK